MMLYTIGFKKNYEAHFEELAKTKEIPIKVGKKPVEKDPNYAGGIVFKTIEEAKKYCTKKKLKGYAVYGLDTVLENTYVHTDKTRRLLESAPVLKLTEK